MGSFAPTAPNSCALLIVNLNAAWHCQRSTQLCLSPALTLHANKFVKPLVLATLHFADWLILMTSLNPFKFQIVGRCSSDGMSLVGSTVGERILLLQLTRSATQPLEKEVLYGQQHQTLHVTFQRLYKSVRHVRCPDVGWLWQAKAYLLGGRFHTLHRDVSKTISTGNTR